MTITEISAFSGLLFGVIGTCLGLFNYFRDKGHIVVLLQWDMEVTGDDAVQRVGCITVTNTGRRAIFISHVALRLPKGEEISHFLIQGGLKGQKLLEGDPPAIFPFDLDGLETYAGKWQEIVAQVSDSTGKKWLSKKIKTIPSWAKTPNPQVNSPCRAN